MASLFRIINLHSITAITILAHPVTVMRGHPQSATPARPLRQVVLSGARGVRATISLEPHANRIPNRSDVPFRCRHVGALRGTIPAGGYRRQSRTGFCFPRQEDHPATEAVVKAPSPAGRGLGWGNKSLFYIASSLPFPAGRRNKTHFYDTLQRAQELCTRLSTRTGTAPLRGNSPLSKSPFTALLICASSARMQQPLPRISILAR